MSVTLEYESKAKITEILTGNTDSMSSAKRTVIHEQFNEGATLTSASTPPVTKTANFVQALTGGAATIDLTSLTGSNGASVTGSGLKVQYFRIKNLGANALTVSEGAATGYELLGNAFSFILAQNQWVTVFGNNATPDISGTLKHIDLAGTTTQTCEVTIVMG